MGRGCVLVAALAVGVCAVAFAEEPASIVTVTTTGKAHATPDVARFTLFVKAEGRTVEEAAANARAKAEKVESAVASLEGVSTQVTLSEPSVFLFRPDSGLGTLDIAGIVLHVSVGDPDVPALKKVWRVVSRAREAGATLQWEPEEYLDYDSLARPFVVVDVKERGPYVAEALAAAAKAAVPRAEAIAVSLGAQLGRLVSVEATEEEEPEGVWRYGCYGEVSIKEDVSKVTISASVTVTYELILKKKPAQ